MAKTVFSTGTIVTSEFLNGVGGAQLKFVHPQGTPLNVMNAGEYWQLSLSDISLASFDSRFVTVNTTQVVSGAKEFTTIPTCALNPVSANDLVNKAYVDTFVTIGGSLQVITGEKFFETIPSTDIEPTNPYHLVNKEYADGFVPNTGDSGIDGTKLFFDVPKCNEQPVDIDDLTNKEYVDNTIQTLGDLLYVRKNGAETIFGVKTFTNLPRATDSPSLPDELVPLSFLSSNYVSRVGDQTISGVKTFTVRPELNQINSVTSSELDLAISFRDTWRLGSNRAEIKATTATAPISSAGNFIDFVGGSTTTFESEERLLSHLSLTSSSNGFCTFDLNPDAIGFPLGNESRNIFLSIRYPAVYREGGTVPKIATIVPCYSFSNLPVTNPTDPSWIELLTPFEELDKNLALACGLKAQVSNWSSDSYDFCAFSTLKTSAKFLLSSPYKLTFAFRLFVYELGTGLEPVQITTGNYPLQFTKGSETAYFTTQFEYS